MSKTHDEIETLLDKVDKTLKASNDVNKVFNSFLKLTDVVLRLDDKETLKEDVFKRLDLAFQKIEAGLKWQNDPGKIQGKLSLYRNMRDIYLIHQDSKVSRCMRVILVKGIMTLTTKNFHRHWYTYRDDFAFYKYQFNFDCKENRKALDTMIDYMIKENLPREHLFSSLMEIKAKYARNKGDFEEAIKLDKDRLIALPTFADANCLLYLQAMYDIAHDYHNLGKFKQANKYLEKLIEKFETLDCVKNSMARNDDHLVLYVEILHKNAEVLTAMKSPKATDACLKYLTYTKTDKDALEVMAGKKMFIAYERQIKQFLSKDDHLERQCAGDIAKADKLIQAGQFLDARTLLTSVKRTLEDVMVSWHCSTNEQYDLLIRVSFYLALSQCGNANHGKAVEGLEYTKFLIDHAGQYKKRVGELGFTLADVYAHSGDCYLYHLNYFEEGLSAYKKFVAKKPDDIDVQEYLNLLICKKKFDVMPKGIQLGWKTGALMYFRSNNHEGATMLQSYVKIQKRKDLFHDFLWSCWLRRLKRPKEAFKLMTDQIQLHFQDSPMQLVNCDVCAFESGHRNQPVRRMEAMLNDCYQREGFTFGCFISLKLSDPYLFLLRIRKDLKDPEGSAVVKTKRRETTHYINSVSLALFARKKLKQTSLAFLYSTFTFTETLMMK